MLYLNCIDISGTALRRHWSRVLNQNFKSGEDFLYNLSWGGWRGWGVSFGWFVVGLVFGFVFCFQEIYSVQLNYVPKFQDVDVVSFKC